MDMEKKIINVVGTMFFKDGKLLINKPRKRPTFQMIGGSVTNGETPLEAAIRECHEELGNQVIFNEQNFEFVMDFIETATSNPDLNIHMHIFKYNGILEGDLTVSDEIEEFMWFGVNDDQGILSNTLKNKILPYALEQKLIFEDKDL